MGGMVRGVLLLAGVLFGMLAPAFVASAAIIDEGRLEGGKLVADSRALDQHALELAPGRSAIARPAGGVIDRLVIRARSVGCSRAELLVTSGPRTDSVLLGSRYGNHALVLRRGDGDRPALTLAARRIRRCRVRIDELRIKAAPQAAPVTVPPRRSIPLGSAVQLDQIKADPALMGILLAGEFRSITPENEFKMERTQREPGKYSFAQADELMAIADEHGLEVRGHTLIFGSQTPTWVGRLLFPQDAERALRAHITTTVSRYKDRIHEWDVVNEALDAQGHYRSNHFFDKLGPRYVEIAFEAARAADPTARLYYNEFEADVPSLKRTRVAKLVKALKDKGLVDGVGLQMHTALGSVPGRDQLLDTMRLYEGMGLEVQITEMDVAARGDGSPQYLALRMDQQAEAYRTAASACLEVVACKRLTVWGLSDRYSWLGSDQIPLLYGDDYAPKPALAAVQSVLNAR